MQNNIRMRFAVFSALAVLQGSNVQAAVCNTDVVERGGNLFARECSVCHAVKEGVAGLMGVSLHAVVGRTSGTLPGFSYSQAMKDKAVPWQVDSLIAFITQPQAFVPGTYMPYMGMAAADSAAVACFLARQ
jgi:cytochrome c